MTRVFLIDDHELVRTGFRMILEQDPEITIVGEADTGEAALTLLRRLSPDVVICDLHLPGISGLEVTERVVRGDYGCRVIIVSVQDGGPLPRRLLEAGAAGYLGKACPANELLRAVREVARGKRYLGGDVAQQLALSSVMGHLSPFDALSPRELEIALMLARGRRIPEIAKRLVISPKTVATHKYRLLDKLGVKNPVALSRLVDQYGLAEAAPTWETETAAEVSEPSLDTGHSASQAL